LNDGNRILATARKIPFVLRVGQNDAFVDIARAARNNLIASGHPATIVEVAGAGHAPFPIAAGESTSVVVRALLQQQLLATP
jgi:pimeloyl-ACP methyl ester carboxylesterase